MMIGPSTPIIIGLNLYYEYATGQILMAGPPTPIIITLQESP